MSKAEKAAVSKKAEAVAAEESGTEDALVLAEKLRNFLSSPRETRALGFFRSLAGSPPPQVLLLEGGGQEERKLAAFYWAALLNCPERSAPCLACPVCLRLFSRTHRDLLYFDGSLGSIKIDEVRGLRSIIGEAPREAVKRVIILAEAQSLTEAAANAMLKSLEEPCSGTVFVLLAPQRERLLPTLVSRSWVLTLAWPDTHGEESAGFGQKRMGSCARHLYANGHGAF